MNRKPALFFVLAFAALLIVCLVFFKFQIRSSSTQPENSAPSDSGSHSKSPEPPPQVARDRTFAAAIIQTQTTEPAPIPATPRTPQQLIAEILEISSTEVPITPEKAEKFRRNLEELIKQGSASVPAIRELLEKKVEYDYADVSGGEKMGYASLRASLIDALRQIGGPDAQEAMVQVLQTSALPSELLAIANNLDQDAPGQYREQNLNAARESLAIGANQQYA